MNTCHSRLIVNSFTVLALLMCHPVYAYDYCDQNRHENNAQISVSQTRKKQLTSSAPATLAITRERISSTWHFTDDHDYVTNAGFDYRYSIMDFEGITPMTNGHLHTWNFPFGGFHSGAQSTLHYYVSPAVSVSSNAFKDPDLINQDGLQLNTGFIYNRPGSADRRWVVGFMSDHRFGHYRLYPVAGLCWNPSPEWRLQLAVPDFSINRNISSDIHISFYARPHGNQWHVFSKDKTEHSDFIYNAVIFGVAAQWRPVSSMSLGIYLMRETRRELSLVLDNGQLLETRIENAVQAGVNAEIFF